MEILDIIYYLAPAFSASAAASIASAVIVKVGKKIIKKKTDDLDKDKNIQDINKKLGRIENEIMEMRGKRK